MRLGLLLFLVTVIHTADGQSSGYQGGFLLTHRLDTVKGLIRFQSRSASPSSCQFKADRKAAAKEYEPGSIHGFCTDDGAYYYSRSIGRTSDVFLEVLVRGYMNLFKFGDIYFVEKGDSVFFELSDEIEPMQEGPRPDQRSRNYTRMLSLLMNDCPEASQRATAVALKDKTLVGLVTFYNTCRGSASTLFRVKGKVKRSTKSRHQSGGPSPN
ncbi:MAG: hypothetical protein JNN04_10955 [Cyclobacteriaceae bacterium]|nr:hypothetical protein [Cyclobacteriaceae bacterium]